MLENFDPNTIQDEAVRQVVIDLMNLVENLPRDIHVGATPPRMKTAFSEEMRNEVS